MSLLIAGGESLLLQTVIAKWVSQFLILYLPEARIHRCADQRDLVRVPRF